MINFFLTFLKNTFYKVLSEEILGKQRVGGRRDTSLMLTGEGDEEGGGSN
jgi:hypothetical protein